MYFKNLIFNISILFFFLFINKLFYIIIEVVSTFIKTFNKRNNPNNKN